MTSVATAPLERTKGPTRRSLERFFSNRAALVGLAIFLPMLVAIITYDW